MTRGRDLSESALGALLLAPAAALLLVIVVYPIAALFWNSIHGVDNANPGAESFVAFANYTRAFDDDRFWRSTWNTVLYVLVTVPGVIVGATAGALAAQAATARLIYSMARDGKLPRPLAHVHPVRKVP